jgi:hypothetical protein
MVKISSSMSVRKKVGLSFRPLFVDQLLTQFAGPASAHAWRGLAIFLLVKMFWVRDN